VKFCEILIKRTKRHAAWTLTKVFHHIFNTDSDYEIQTVHNKFQVI